MISKGDLIYAWASDPLIRERGESGGAVTALLRFALEDGMVDAVLGVMERCRHIRCPAGPHHGSG